MEDKVLLAVVLPLLLLSLLKLKSWLQRRDVKLPPGPSALPIIGSFHHLLTSPQPFRALRDLSDKYGPLMFLKLGQTPVVVASSAEAARVIMKTNDLTFASRSPNAATEVLAYNSTDVIFSAYTDRWRELRKICVVELMSNSRVHSFRRIREEEVARLLQFVAESAASGRTFDLSERISKLVNDTVVREIVGSRVKNQDVYLHELEIANEASSGFSFPDLFPSLWFLRSLATPVRQAQTCHDKVHVMLQDIIRERKEYLMSVQCGQEPETLLDVLLRLQKQDVTSTLLDNHTISAVLFDMFAAGSETSSTTMKWVMAELMRNPGVMEKAKTEVREVLEGKPTVTEDDLGKLTYLKLVIKEALRLRTPAPLLLPRRCRETCKVMGYDIPKGTTVLVNAWAICRDSKYWEDPEEFKPERFEGATIDFKGTDYEYLPFGAGRRMCPGFVLGVANIELAVASLLYHFDWKLPDGMKPEEMDMSEAAATTAKRQASLDVHAIPHIVPCAA